MIYSLICFCVQYRFAAGVLFDGWMYPVREDVCALGERAAATPLLLLNYEKFQWRSNLEAMAKLLRPNTAEASRCLTVKSAVHYAATDLPTIMNGSYVSKVLGLMEWLFNPRRGSGGAAAEAQNSLTAEQGLALSISFFSSFLIVGSPEPPVSFRCPGWRVASAR